MGTAQYLAPEQATGQTATGASDIYSLGVIGYECLTGHRPFSGESQIAIALAQVNDAPPPLPETLPKPVRALLMSMLAKDPKNRPANAIKLAEAAEAIRNGDIQAAHAAVPGMLLYEGATGPITAPVNMHTAPTGVIGSEKSSTATSALPVLGAAAAGAAAAGAAGAAGGDGTPTRAGSTLSRADALAAERSWVQEEERYDDEPADEPERRGRSPWTWPLIALILLVLFALAGFLLNQAGILFPSQSPATTSAAASSPPSTSASPTPTTTSATPTPTPTPTQTTPETVNVIADAYLGRQFTAVRDELNALGLQVDGQEVFDTAAPGTVTGVNPTGPVQPGGTVTVTYSKGPEKVKVPNLSPGSTEAQVRAAIEGAGLRWVKGADVDGEPGQATGTFVSSDPASGSEVNSESVVTYHLAKPPAPTTTSTPSPTPTPTPSVIPSTPLGQG
jgi:serine/threonine-protein kinase